MKKRKTIELNAINICISLNIIKLHKQGFDKYNKILK